MELEIRETAQKRNAIGREKRHTEARWMPISMEQAEISTYKIKEGNPYSIPVP